MNLPESLTIPAGKVEAIFKKHKITVTQGGEPTYVPVNPEGLEWAVTAVGPTKLNYAYALADALAAHDLAGCANFYSPGKSYPGEPNPRWVLYLLNRHDGQPLVTLPHSDQAIPPAKLDRLRKKLSQKLSLTAAWIKGSDPLDAEATTWILPLDHDEKQWLSASWKKKTMRLIAVEGPAGLRLPLNEVPENLSRRALTLEWKAGAVSIFFPPLLQDPFLELLAIFNVILQELDLGNVRFQGYIPSDDAKLWSKLGIASDPGVLEINIPPCTTWTEYAGWMETLERNTAKTNLRSLKVFGDQEFGTGGGNHVCFGGPSTDENAFFTHPGWVTSILRFWQHHPSLSYLFTGAYVGSSSQAPRTDESARGLYDLEMAYQYLESLPRGDHRQIINETLRHLHIDGSGNTHRSEISFDKFWNTSFPGGACGILEFRAVETLPKSEWMSAVALLWRSIIGVLLAHPFHEPLKDFGPQLHDRYFLPSWLWEDLTEILAFLAGHGIELPPETFRAIWEWRFPILLETKIGRTSVIVRKALESWPLLCEQPLEGGSTSRFVDTSIERLEITASTNVKVRFQGRKLTLAKFPLAQNGSGLRFRKTALYPSLHPGIPPQLPLQLSIETASVSADFSLFQDSPAFVPVDKPVPKAPVDCRKSQPELLTYDLRL